MLKNRFKKILVALDGSANSRAGMNEAISLARQSEGSITGIYVLPGFTSEPTTKLSFLQRVSFRKVQEIHVKRQNRSRKTWDRV